MPSNYGQFEQISLNVSQTIASQDGSIMEEAASAITNPKKRYLSNVNDDHERSKQKRSERNKNGVNPTNRSMNMFMLLVMKSYITGRESGIISPIIILNEYYLYESNIPRKIRCRHFLRGPDYPGLGNNNKNMEILKFIHINLHKAHLAGTELLKRVHSLRHFVCLVQEPNVYTDRVCYKPPGAKSFPSSYISKQPRAAIFVSKGVYVTELPSLEDDNTAVVMMKIRDENVIVASLYLDGNNPVATPVSIK